MDKKSLEEYLKKLEGFEKTLSQDEENVDDAYINEIAKVLSDLSMDSLAHDEEIGKQFKNSDLTVPNEDTLTFNKDDAYMHATLNCKIKLLHPDAVVPQYSKFGDAGLDLSATTVVVDEESNQITYGTGVSLEIPIGFVGLVYPRSSIRKTNLSLTNSVGVIDSGYRGEIMATFNRSNSNSNEIYEVGDRICQLMILPYPKINFILSDDLSETERGSGGFGSTGK